MRNIANFHLYADFFKVFLSCFRNSSAICNITSNTSARGVLLATYNKEQDQDENSDYSHDGGVWIQPTHRSELLRHELHRSTSKLSSG